jgi:hypothetical protein
MKRNKDILLTAIAPIIWGSTYYVTTEYLPNGYLMNDRTSWTPRSATTSKTMTI